MKNNTHSKADKTFVLSITNLVIDLEKEIMKSNVKYSKEMLLCDIKHALGEISDSKKDKKICIQEEYKTNINSIKMLALELRDSLAALMSSCDFVDFVELVDNAIYKAESSMETMKFRIDRQQWRLIKIHNKDSRHIIE